MNKDKIDMDYNDLQEKLFHLNKWYKKLEKEKSVEIASLKAQIGRASEDKWIEIEKVHLGYKE